MVAVTVGKPNNRVAQKMAFVKVASPATLRPHDSMESDTRCDAGCGVCSHEARDTMPASPRDGLWLRSKWARSTRFCTSSGTSRSHMGAVMVQHARDNDVMVDARSPLLLKLPGSPKCDGGVRAERTKLSIHASSIGLNLSWSSVMACVHCDAAAGVPPACACSWLGIVDVGVTGNDTSPSAGDVDNNAAAAAAVKDPPLTDAPARRLNDVVGDVRAAAPPVAVAGVIV